jgi:hypothetical protein
LQRWKKEQSGTATRLRSSTTNWCSFRQTLGGGNGGLSDEVSAPKTQITAERLSAEFAELRREFSALKVKAGGIAAPPAAPPPAPNRLPAPTPAKVPAAPAQPPAPAPSPPAPGGFDSLIVSDFPAIFAEFRGKQFKLLWRGSRDGFGASKFHGRCDGHANTLTVILDTDGNIFGGFTPVEWESWGGWKADNIKKSFLFTLKNPHNIAPWQFAFYAEKNENVIVCEWI